MKAAFVNVLLLVILFSGTLGRSVPEKQTKSVHPDLGLDVKELVQKYGYPIETHGNLETEDGYLLEIHRIPHGKNNSQQANKPPVLLMHGLLSSSADWVNMGSEKSIGFLLADLGYDVWMGNARGNTWSRKHKTMDPDVDKVDFWNFSWDEIGTYDLPTMIDHIISTTGQDKIFYIGHSQGTTAFFVMTSQRPEYNDKIRLFMAFSPVAYVGNLYSPLINSLLDDIDQWKALAESMGIYELLRYSQAITDMVQLLCNDDASTQPICADFLFALCGDSPDQLNKTMIPIIASNAPAGIATKQLYHYSQIVATAEFKRYDYGTIENLQIYGQDTPPLFDLKKITAPLALFYGKNDWLVSIVDAQSLSADLPNVVLDRLLDYEKFNHLDFLWATDVKSMLYNEVFEVMKNY